MQIENYIFSNPEIIKSVSFQLAKRESVNSVFELNKLRTVSTTFKNVIDKEEALLYCQIWYGNALACKKACKNYLIIENLFNDLEMNCSRHDIIEILKELDITRKKLKAEKAQFAFFKIFCNALDSIQRKSLKFEEVWKSYANSYDLQSSDESGECSEYDIKDVSKELAIAREKLKDEIAQYTFFTISFDDYNILHRIQRTNSTFQGVIKSLDSFNDLQLDFDSKEGTFSTGMFLSPTACFGFLSYNKQDNSLPVAEKLRRITKY